MKRKITSLLLALVMTLALAVPAFATSTTPYAEIGDPKSETSQSLTFNATTRVPVLSLSLPTLADNPVVFNPYQVSYTTDADTLNGQAVGDATDQTKQIISPVYAIRNLSDTQLTVGVKAETTAEGIILGTSVADQTKKQAAIRVDFITTKAETPEAAVLIDTGAEQNIANLVTTLKTAGASNSNVMGDFVNDFYLDTKKAAEIKVADKKLTLEKTVGGETVADANYLLFQFNGEAAANPTEGWTSSDKFTTILTFTFQPGVPTRTKVDAGAESSGTVSFNFTEPTDKAATPGYVVTGATLGTAPACTFSATDATGYSASAAAGTKFTKNVDITYEKANGAMGTIFLTVEFTKS